jgi:hypothetical protein
MQPPTPPKPPEEVLIVLPTVARRWDSRTEAVETVLQRAGVQIIDVPQRPKKGVRLSDLLAFEANWRLATQKEREADREAHKNAIERGKHRKEQADQHVAEALSEEVAR